MTWRGDRVGANSVASESGRSFNNVDPATEEILGQYPYSTISDVDRAVGIAREAFRDWRGYPAPRRAEILFRAGEIMLARKEELARELTREMGKVLPEARGDVQESIDLAYYFAGEGRRLLGITTPSESRQKMAYSVRVPVGVIGAISPFNFPLAIPALKTFPAIIAGNTVVLKPAADTPRMAELLVEIFDDAGLPPGVFNVVYGRGEEVGRRLVEHPDIALITFTGSKDVGIEVLERAAPSLKKMILELGGKNSIIVLDDADLDLAVKAIVWSAYGTSGQRCTSASRIIAHAAVYAELIDKLAEATAALNVGSGLEESTDVGPVINQAAVDRVRRYVAIGTQEGAELMVGGRPLARPGFYFEPTLFVGAEPGMQLVTDEIFGPLTAVMRARDFEDALRIANDSQYGLSASIFTESIGAAMRAAESIETGLFYVNAGTTGAEAHLPTGGMKASGNGHREAGVAALDSYSEWRSVYIDYSHRLQRAQIDLEPPQSGPARSPASAS